MKSVIMRGTGAYVPADKVYNAQMDGHFKSV